MPYTVQIPLDLARQLKRTTPHSHPDTPAALMSSARFTCPRCQLDEHLAEARAFRMVRDIVRFAGHEEASRRLGFDTQRISLDPVDYLGEHTRRKIERHYGALDLDKSAQDLHRDEQQTLAALGQL